MIGCLAFLLLPALCAVTTRKSTLLADNWPQFRGPDGAGISAEKDLPAQWSDTVNLKWKTPLPGPGSSSPIVWGDRVIVTCYSGYGVEKDAGEPGQLQRHLLCVSRKDGTILWQQAVDSAAKEDRYNGYITEHGYASNTPATDGLRVYAFFGKTGVMAFDMEGKKLWQTSVGIMSGNRRWGSAASPILYKDMVIVNAGDEDRTIYALDKATGKVTWKAHGDQLDSAYGTPIVATGEGDQRELLLAVPGEIWGLNPDTGKLVWWAQSRLDGNICPGVVADKDNVYAFGGFPKTGSAAVRRKGQGDVTGTHLLWTADKGPYVPTPVLNGWYLYWLDDLGKACCMEASTGKMIFKESLQIPGRGKLVYAGTVMANEQLYSVTRSGGTVVWAARPEFKEIARNQFPSDTSDFNAVVALSGGAVFLRSNKFLYCVETARSAPVEKPR